MKKIYLILKLVFFFIVSLCLFYLFEYGFIFDAASKLIGPVLLSGLTAVMLFKPNLKRQMLFLSSICLVVMVLLYIFNFSDWSKKIGDFGFSLLMITIFLYLPQIIKNGHIEKF